MQALGDVVFAALLVGVVGPAVVVARVRIGLPRADGAAGAAGATDAVAGRELRVEVECDRRVRVRPLDPPGPVQMIGPVRRSRRRASAGTVIPAEKLILEPDHRGAYRSVLAEVASAAPFGIQWWSRRVELSRPDAEYLLYVAPRRGRAAPVKATADPSTGSIIGRRSWVVGELRAARPYVSGDLRSAVHWPATAHTGELMVRETEATGAEPIEIVVSLPPDPDQAERAAEDALAKILDALDRNVPVVVSTEEAGGPRRAGVDDRRQAGRRLAAAVAHPA